MSDHPELLNGAYALDALNDAERTAVERHLRECATCAVEVAGFVETVGRISEPVTPPAELRAKVLGEARVTRQTRPRVQVGRPRRLLAAAAAVAVLAGAVGTTWWVQETRIAAVRQETVPVLSAPDARLRVSADAKGGRFTAVYSESRDAAVLTFEQLGALPEGKTYQLWRVSGGKAESLEVLRPGIREGSLVVEGLGPQDGLAVSVEDEGGAKQPSDVYATVAMGE